MIVSPKCSTLGARVICSSWPTAWRTSVSRLSGRSVMRNRTSLGAMEEKRSKVVPGEVKVKVKVKGGKGK